jgi:predicted transposase/invertase (TIGR01784 family)
MYDNICKFLAENFSSDFASWLLGEPITLTTVNPKELSLDPIRPDSLILQASPNRILHLEFQTDPDPKIPFRMADYRLRIYRRFGDKETRQFVIYLRQTNSPLVYQNTFTLPRSRHEFEIIRMWEQPTELFLSSVGLFPLATLSRTPDRSAVLKQVAERIEKIGDKTRQNNVAASTSVLAGLVLEQQLIQRLLRNDIMKESVIYQAILKEGEEKGIQQGIQQGRQEGRQEGLQEGLVEGRQQVAMNLLASGFNVEQVAKLTGLSTDQLLLLPNQDKPTEGVDN